MDAFDLPGQLRTLSNTNGWVFLYGDDFFKEYEATQKVYSSGQLILGADPFVTRPTYTNHGQLSSITYTGLILLGRKREVQTRASLDETNIQKYDRRLLDLTNTLSQNLISFACDNELTLSSVQKY